MRRYNIANAYIIANNLYSDLSKPSAKAIFIELLVRDKLVNVNDLGLTNIYIKSLYDQLNYLESFNNIKLSKLTYSNYEQMYEDIKDIEREGVLEAFKDISSTYFKWNNTQLKQKTKRT